MGRVSSLFIVLAGCRPQPAQAPVVEDDVGDEASPPVVVEQPVQRPAGKFKITLQSRCKRPVTVHFAPMRDEFTPGVIPDGARSVTVPAGELAAVTMDPGEGAWIVDEVIGTTARTGFGEGVAGWEGTLAIGPDCRSFAD